MSNRVVTVRLPAEQCFALETVARFDGVALAEEIREGIELLLTARKNDPEFQARVRESFERARELLQDVDGAEQVVEALRTPAGAEGVAASETNVAATEGALAGA